MKNERSANHFFIVLLFVSAVLVFFIFRPYLTPIILGAALAVVFAPLSSYLGRGFKGKGTAEALLTTLLVFLIILIPAVFYGLKIAQEAGQAYSSLLGGGGLGNALSSLMAKAQNYIPWIPVTRINLQNYFKNGLSYLLNNFGAVFSGAMDLLVSFLISLITLYVLLKNGRTIKEKIMEWSPLPERLAEEIIERVRSAISSVIRGTLAISVIQGLLAGAGFMIFGVPQPLLWGLACVFAGLIPFAGSGLITVPAAIYLFFSGSPLSALGMLLWGILFVGLVDNVLRPFLMEKGVNIHPFLILLGVLGGISLFGPIGFLLGPVLITLLFALLDIYPRTVADLKED